MAIWEILWISLGNQTITGVPHMIYSGTQYNKMKRKIKNRFVMPNLQFSPKMVGHNILWGTLFKIS
jgi:hypothetical protein